MKVISFGEILWDIIGDTEHIGGASLNFAAHLAKLGGESYLVSALGNDERGDRGFDALVRHGIQADYINRVSDAPTGTVTVKLEAGQPSYTIHEGVAWDCIRLKDEQLAAIQAGDWDCFYFGTLAQRSEINRTTLCTLFEKVRARHRFYDINLRQRYYSWEIIDVSLRHATIVKLNNDELDLVAEMFGLDGTGSPEEHMNRLTEQFGLESLIVTRGKDGVTLLSGGSLRQIPVEPVEVADAVGAGDSFSAGFMYALGRGKDPFEAAGYGAALGSFTAARSGGVPDYDDTIRSLFANLGG
ncbi:carbohydrate kinase [Marispirochaeta aestuarii]|uniref:carbohydrate kinase family protein n=1 Tax=Marispirochaeta aestuarii TaxID=1963862 RepID=UPI002ABD33FA|nr:carbohydrate kinase [Marispirochaeta aestuarii]